MKKKRIYIMMLLAAMLIVALPWGREAHAQETTTETLTLGCALNENAITALRERALLNEIGKRIGKTFVLEFYPSKRVLYEANAGNLDGDAGRVRELSTNPDYPNLRIVDAPYCPGTLQVFAREDADISIERWEDMLPYRIDYVRGTVLVENKLAEYQFPAENLDAVVRNTQLFLKLRAERTDLVITWYTDLTLADIQFMQENQIVSVATLHTIVGFLYLYKRHAKLIPVIQEALIEMDNDGTRQKILADIDAQLGMTP